MFTGLIEQIGKVKSLSKKKALLHMSIACDFAGELSLGESVAVDGVCLTVTKAEKGIAFFDIMSETASDTCLGLLRPGSPVNLERALRADSRMGGHIVSGHVHCRSRIAGFSKLRGNVHVSVALPPGYEKGVTHKGSVAVHGVSLTVQEVKRDRFMVSLIPETMKRTTFQFKRAGDLVNLEFDSPGSLGIESQKKLSEKALRAMGY